MMIVRYKILSEIIGEKNTPNKLDDIIKKIIRNIADELEKKSSEFLEETGLTPSDVVLESWINYNTFEVNYRFSKRNKNEED